MKILQLFLIIFLVCFFGTSALTVKALEGGEEMLENNLKMGDTGEEVATLQKMLKKDPSVYPEGLVTGYFDFPTKQAVIRFQEKYKEEILTPLGLTKGTGNVGLTTRQQLNLLYTNFIPKIQVYVEDVVAYANKPVELTGHAITITGEEIIKYEWDFDGDGRYDWESSETASTTHTYSKVGIYRARFRATSINGFSDFAFVKVEVKSRFLERLLFPEEKPAEAPAVAIPADGITTQYAIMINGSSEERFWEGTNWTYSVLTNYYDFTPDRIYLLNHNGTDLDGNNPNDMIDYSATKENVEKVFNELRGKIDEDDVLFFWYYDHGNGYYGPGTAYYGYSSSKPEIDEDDEQDYLEKDFKLRGLYTYRGGGEGNHGMDIWININYWTAYSGNYYYRIKDISHFNNMILEDGSEHSDNDILIEEFTDYLLGDTNKNGIIEEGEIIDFDNDGIPPYNSKTEEFDEDDWGNVDKIKDNYEYGVRDRDITIFDNNLDNKLDIDINSLCDIDDLEHCDTSKLDVDGTDLDNDGLFDGVDINDDGDMDDWVSIDESILLYGSILYDDELAVYLDSIKVKVMPVIVSACFSGGFVDDLSGPNRIIMTPDVEENTTSGTRFIRGFASAFAGKDMDGNLVDADSNKDKKISMVEAFNYTAENNYISSREQYDDNGDKISHEYPIPNGGDGDLGSNTYFIEKEGISFCTDSDNGDYYSKGTVSYKDEEHTDVCINSSILKEYSCLGEFGTNGISEEEYECFYGCENDACKKGISVLFPNGGERIEIGKTYDITWKASGIGEWVKIQLVSYNESGKASYSRMISVSSSSGKYSWTINPEVYVALPFKEKVKIIILSLNPEINPEIKDESDDYFSIVEDIGADFTLISTTAQTSPFPSYFSDVKRVTAKINFKVEPVGGVLSLLSKSSIKMLAYDENGLYKPVDMRSVTSCTVIQNPDRDISEGESATVEIECIMDYLDLWPFRNIRYEITDINYEIDGKAYSYQPTNFTTNWVNVGGGQKSITIVSPNGGEEWEIGKTYDITWEAEEITKNLEIYLRDDRAGPSYKLIATDLLGSSRKYSWNIPSDFWGSHFPGTAYYKIQVREIGIKPPGEEPTEGTYDESDNHFSVIEHEVEGNWCDGADINKDGKVWLEDWGPVRANFENVEKCSAENSWCQGGDIDKDKKVWLTDWGILRANFGSTGCFGPMAKLALDIDDNGIVDSDTDGMMIQGYLFGFTGDSLVVTGVNAKRNTSDEIEGYLDCLKNLNILDVDDNGKYDALTDGTLIIRYMEGYTGQDLTNNVVAMDAKRTDPQDIINFLINPPNWTSDSCQNLSGLKDSFGDQLANIFNVISKLFVGSNLLK